jgi:type IV pilus assembly protein PilY1
MTGADANLAYRASCRLPETSPWTVRMAAWLVSVLALAAWTMPAKGAPAEPGHLPLAYVTAQGAYSWTGRLRAIAFRPEPADRSVALAADAWEAGVRLRERGPMARSIFTALGARDGMPQRLAPLTWPALDDLSRRALDDGSDKDSGLGQARLAWLRGRMDIDGGTGLRPRDTALAHAAGARAVVVPPPTWLAGRPGHAAFQQQYGLRATTVWLGTSDGLLHGFDALTGEELSAYLPGMLLPRAASAANANGQMVQSPCPRPESVDANLAGTWRTLLLCGVGRSRNPDGREHASAEQHDPTGVFVLDISNVASPMPVRLIWEQAASATLPLSPAGPVRAALLDDKGQDRWYAVVPMTGAATTQAPGPPSLALLPLDKPAIAPWLDRYAIRQLDFPATGCDDGTPALLTAVTVAADAYGRAVAAYATDGRGRLWRADLQQAAAPDQSSPVTCLHHLRAGGHTSHAEPPVLFAIAGGTLVVHGAGNQMAAVADKGGNTKSAPRKVSAQANGAGFILRAEGPSDVAAGVGWTLRLPRPDEQLDEILPADPGYLGFVTRTADNRLHAYLVLATTGESLIRDTETSPLTYVATGHTVGDAANVVVHAEQRSLPSISDPQPGATTRNTYDLSLWAMDGINARRLVRTVASRRVGRLGWRELVDPGAP